MVKVHVRNCVTPSRLEEKVSDVHLIDNSIQPKPYYINSRSNCFIFRYYVINTYNKIQLLLNMSITFEQLTIVLYFYYE